MSRLSRFLAPAAVLLVAVASARADDMPVIKVEMRDGVILPAVIEVPVADRVAT